MIKAQEIRIGNYVLFDGRIDTIGGIESKSDGSAIVCLDNAGYPETDIAPIPLTEEILLKCGFENIGSKEYPNCKLGIYVCMCRKDGINICNNHGFIADLESLHQLQNLYFALTGEELNVEL